MGMGRKKISYSSADVENFNRRFAYSKTCQAIDNLDYQWKALWNEGSYLPWK
jgi:hypothetical protein